MIAFVDQEGDEMLNETFTSISIDTVEKLALVYALLTINDRPNPRLVLNEVENWSSSIYDGDRDASVLSDTDASLSVNEPRDVCEGG